MALVNPVPAGALSRRVDKTTPHKGRRTDFALLGKKAHGDGNGFGQGNISLVGRVRLGEPNPSNLRRRKISLKSCLKFKQTGRVSEALCSTLRQRVRFNVAFLNLKNWTHFPS